MTDDAMVDNVVDEREQSPMFDIGGAPDDGECLSADGERG
jgi:hypothetical protein